MKHLLPKIDNNIAEGFVLRPLEENYVDNKPRHCIKRKSEQFKEITSKPKNPKKKDQADGEVQENTKE